MRLLNCNSGSVASTFAIMVPVVAAMIGLSIDGARYVAVRQTLQAVVDDAVIAQAAYYQAGNSGSEPIAAYFATNWKHPYGAPVPGHSVSTPGANVVEATATLDLSTTFARVMGISTLPMTANAQARYGVTAVDVALAVDVTGSMAGAKIDSLKVASKSLVGSLLDAANGSGKIKVSLVPFANYVNVGTQYRNQSWLSVGADRTETQCYKSKPLISKSGCTTTQVPVTIEGQGTVMVGSESCTSYIYGPETDVCGPVEVKWNGCVGSRAAPLNKQAMLTATNPIPGLENFTCSAPLTRLTTDRAALETAIDALTPSGETYLPSGLMWGWRTVSPNGPFGDSPITSGAAKPRRYLVLMSDGENTKSQDSIYHWGAVPADANALTEQLCTEIKAEGIELFMIAYDVTHAPTVNMMQSCASSSTHFFQATDAISLKATFDTIARSVTVVRLSR